MPTNNYFKVYVPQTMLGVFPFDDTNEASIALAWSGVQSMKAHVESVIPIGMVVVSERSAVINRYVGVWRQPSAFRGPWLTAQVIAPRGL